MPARSPSARETERLLDLLYAYDREELWLRIRRYYRLADQPDQVWVDVVDADGIALADRWGRVRTHTLQVCSTRLQATPNQLVHLARAGDSVRVRVLPKISDLLFDLYLSEPQEPIGP